MADRTTLRLWRVGKRFIVVLAVAYIGIAVVALNFAARFLSAVTGWNILWAHPVFDDATTHLVAAGIIAGIALVIRWLSSVVQRRLLWTAMRRYDSHVIYRDYVEAMLTLIQAQHQAFSLKAQPSDTV